MAGTETSESLNEMSTDTPLAESSPETSSGPPTSSPTLSGESDPELTREPSMTSSEPLDALQTMLKLSALGPLPIDDYPSQGYEESLDLSQEYEE